MNKFVSIPENIISYVKGFKVYNKMKRAAIIFDEVNLNIKKVKKKVLIIENNKGINLPAASGVSPDTEDITVIRIVLINEVVPEVNSPLL